MTNCSLNQSNAPDINVHLHIIALNTSETFYPSIMIIQSNLSFQIMYLESSNIIMMDVNSTLNANGTGFTEGIGFNRYSDGPRVSGGSYGGQGGNCLDVVYNKTYGVPHLQYMNFDTDNSTYFIGSGGGVDHASSP